MPTTKQLLKVLTSIDVEYSILTGKIRRTWPREGKYEIVGSALDGRSIGVVCRITQTGKVRVITRLLQNKISTFAVLKRKLRCRLSNTQSWAENMEVNSYDQEDAFRTSGAAGDSTASDRK